MYEVKLIILVFALYKKKQRGLLLNVYTYNSIKYIPVVCEEQRLYIRAMCHNPANKLSFNAITEMFTFRIVNIVPNHMIKFDRIHP